MSQYPGEDEEEEEQSASPSQLRKAWFAGHADAEHGISASWRGVPGVPHGGSQSVSADDTAGSIDLCWCGLPFDHDWPGKAGGRKHPRQETNVSSTENSEQPRIERRQLRAYHADLVDVIMTAVNEYHVRYRMTANSVLLFPPDGTAPYTINARNGDRQRKSAQQWFVRHCVPKGEPIRTKSRTLARVVDEEAIRELAESVDSEEHLSKLDEEKPDRHKAAKAAAQPAPQPEQPKKAAQPEKSAPPAQESAEKPAEKPAEEPAQAESSEEWKPYMTGSGASRRVHQYALTNGTQVKCPEHGWIGKPGGLGGHTRTHHMNTDTLWGHEAKKKAVTTYFTNKATGQVAEGITLIQTALGIEPPAADTSALEAQIKELKAKNKALTTRNGELEAKVTDLEAKHGELEAKFALAKEAFGL